MKQKFKNLIKIGILVFGISIFTTNCSKEDVDKIELTEIEQLQNNFTLENFDDIFIKNNLIIDWDNFNSKFNSKNELITYEFNSHFKVRNTIEKYSKYNILASKNDLNEWSFEIIKFSTNKDKINNNNLSYYSTNEFTGTIYHYNLNGENTLIKVYSKGKIIEEISINSFDNITNLSKAPAIGGTHCNGCWMLVPVKHQIDWYSNSGGGSTLYYSHTTEAGTTLEWVYIPPNDEYQGMPFDAEDNTYHNHFDSPHGGANTDNHDDEEVVDGWIEDVTQQRNLLCGSYAFTSVGNATVANISGLGMSIRKGYLGIDAEFSSPLCITITNTIPAHASALFNSAWNEAMSQTYTYLNATYTITAPTPEQLKTHLLGFLNANLQVLGAGSIASSNSCSGSIPTTQASYCP
ncbi:hypothetical protein [Lacinutrix salivirga]